MAGSITKNMLNIGGADPIQGYDVGVWVHDAGTGDQILLGQFTSIVVTVRNATEAYMEFGQRYPRYLDGEFQIAFVMEKGLLDLNVFQETFGFKRLARNKRFGRSPRMNITFSSNPVDADVLEEAIGTHLDTITRGGGTFTRDVTGRFILEQCKIDSWHFASQAGRQVVATQWQGVAEGFAAISSDASTTSDLGSPQMGTTITIPGTGNGSDFYRVVPDGVATTDTNLQGYDGVSNG